jgi:outer membrane protein assembly factor BamA
MSRNTTIYLPLSLLFVPLLLAQDWRPTENKWTDKNNTENAAAYLLRMTYYQRGYCGAKVEIKQDGSRRLFIVEPGEIFHLNDVAVIGLRTFPADKLMRGSPKSGDVFSSARINEWVEQIRKNYGGKAGPLQHVNFELSFDYGRSQVSVRLMIQEQN